MDQLATKIKEHSDSLVGFSLIIIFICIAYSNIPSQQFLEWDDTHYVLSNRHIQSFTLSNVIWMLTDFSMGNWHPLTWLSYAVNYAIWGDNPLPYKMINLLIHALNSVLVYFLTFRLLKHAKHFFHTSPSSGLYDISDNELKFASIFIGILFSVHPLHVESVSWISERKDVLYSLFCLLTIICYLKHKEEKDKRWYITSIVMYLMSLSSKSMSVTLPAVLILLDIYPLRTIADISSVKHKIKELLHNKTTYILLSFLVSLIAILTQKSAIQAAEILPLESRLINAFMSIFQYLYRFLIPDNLSTFYSFHPWATDPNFFSILPVAAFIATTGILIFLANKKQIYFPIVAWLYFIITLLPVIGLIKVGGQASADRYTYMPLLSIYVVFASVVAIALHRSKQKIYQKYTLLALLLAWLASLTYLTNVQNTYWRDDKTLWTRAIDLEPGISAMPYSNLGANYINSKNLRAAIVPLNKSIDIQPKNSTALQRLGKAYELMAKDKMAMFAYKKIIETLPTDATGYVVLGDFYYRKNKVDQAKILYNKAFEIIPNIPATLQRSALVDFLEHDYNSAEKKLTFVLQMMPNDIGSMQILANTKLNMGKVDEARKIAQTIRQKNPSNSFAIQFLNDLEKSNQ